MLNEKTIEIVKSTAPVLQQHGEGLTRHFYQRMFRHNPEVAPFFNPANQSSGKQQRALAGAIIAYAANIDNLTALGSAVELIAHKHVSLMIKPEHYPIVGENLLASIREVLGDAATEDIISAWEQAYAALADILIDREATIYDANLQQEGGWSDFKEFRIIRKEQESSNITSFYLAKKDGSILPNFKPGQYITLRVKTPDGSTTMRNYSLSDQPGKEYFRISVKREPAPTADIQAGYVSNLLHDKIEVGDLIEVAPPCGDFFLDAQDTNTRPLVFLAAGVGITPIKSMLLTALKAFPQRQIVLVHACINKEMQAFRENLNKLAETYDNLKIYHRYSSENATIDEANSSQGLVTAEYLHNLLNNHDAEYYFCGPQPFMKAVYKNLQNWDIDSSQMHFEFFGPRQELEN